MGMGLDHVTSKDEVTAAEGGGVFLSVVTALRVKFRLPELTPACVLPALWGAVPASTCLTNAAPAPHLASQMPPH